VQELGSAGLVAFRAGLQAWLHDTVPRDWRQWSNDDRRALSVWWCGAIRDAGYGPPHWSAAVGGPGLSLAQQRAVYEELTLADCPAYPGLFACAYTHVHDTLMAHGTPEQRDEHLGPILAGERVWAQAFSEPEAGSDLASLRTSARRDCDTYVVNGQKVWSTTAPDADWAILLARTDPTAPKRRGISYLLVDLRTPGIEIRPIRQITGVEDDFAEIFFSDVAIPARNLVGAEHDGWRVAQATLSAERGPLAVPAVIQLRRAVEEIGARARRRSPDPATFAMSAVGQRYAQAHGDVEILSEMMDAMLARSVRTLPLGPESSILKLYIAPLMQRVTALGLEVAGLDAHLAHGGERDDLPSGDWLMDHLKSWVWTIAGGSDQIQRTILGERVLGLPRDPLVD
jgi:alkylation response protein AidB-like acyl-CoA dehydrogenase